jgi:hypothetical protein
MQNPECEQHSRDMYKKQTLLNPVSPLTCTTNKHDKILQASDDKEKDRHPWGRKI